MICTWMLRQLKQAKLSKLCMQRWHRSQGERDKLRLYARLPQCLLSFWQIGSAWVRSYSILSEMQLPIPHKVGWCQLPWNALMPSISHWLLQIQALVFQMMTWSAFLSVSTVPIPRGREHRGGLGWDSLLCATWSTLWEDRLRLRVRL